MQEDEILNWILELKTACLLPVADLTRAAAGSPSAAPPRECGRSAGMLMGVTRPHGPQQLDAPRKRALPNEINRVPLRPLFVSPFWAALAAWPQSNSNGAEQVTLIPWLLFWPAN